MSSVSLQLSAKRQWYNFVRQLQTVVIFSPTSSIQAANSITMIQMRNKRDKYKFIFE